MRFQSENAVFKFLRRKTAPKLLELNQDTSRKTLNWAKSRINGEVMQKEAIASDSTFMWYCLLCCTRWF